MGKLEELYALQRSFSGDASVNVRSRSGEIEESSAIMFDFVTHVSSAEDDIVASEELDEYKSSKVLFVKMLRAYFKKILMPVEYKFLAYCVRANKSLAAIARELGLKSAQKIVESIQVKCKQNEKTLFMIMSYSGYDCRRGCEFLKSLFNASAARRRVKDKIEALAERNRECLRVARVVKGDYIRERDRKYYAAHSEIKKARVKAYAEANREKVRERRREYRRANAEKIKAWYEANREKIRERKREYRRANREKIRERKREYRRANREKISERRKAIRLGKKNECLEAGRLSVTGRK